MLDILWRRRPLAPGHRLVREVTGMKRKRIYQYTAYLELLNREGES